VPPSMLTKKFQGPRSIACNGFLFSHARGPLVHQSHEAGGVRGMGELYRASDTKLERRKGRATICIGL
jgi:hypothetical protein